MIGCPMCGSPVAPLASIPAAELLARVADVPYRLAKIVVTISEAEGYHCANVRKDGRELHLLAVRDKIIRRARLRGYSYPQIGRALNRDSSTIAHAAARLGLAG